MTVVIALTQFVFIALGTLAVTILSKASSNQSVGLDAGRLDFIGFLAAYGIWLLLVPMGWSIYSVMCGARNKGLFRPALAQASGVTLAAVICIIYGYAIFSVRS